jgi:ADP-heptose:LPS heptosyltransferase
MVDRHTAPSANQNLPRSGTRLSTINSQLSTRAQRVLILQLKRIGDVLLTTPVIAALRAHAPDCHITLALDAGTSALATALGADRVLVRGRDFWRGLAGGGFDVCLDLTGNDRSALAALVSRAPRRITWSRFAKKPLRRVVYTEFVESSVKTRHTADHHTDLLRALGIAAEGIPMTLALPEDARAEAAAALSEVREPFAVVHPGTARPEKYWLPARWAEVISTLREEHGLTVVLTGSNAPEERAHLDAIQAALPESCVEFAGKLSLLGSAAVLERARLVCAVDSAPVHFADALGRPVIALFGPTNPFHWRPRRATARLVTAAEVAEITPDYPKAPMSDIRVEPVLDAVRELLQCPICEA